MTSVVVLVEVVYLVVLEETDADVLVTTGAVSEVAEVLV